MFRPSDKPRACNTDCKLSSEGKSLASLQLPLSGVAENSGLRALTPLYKSVGFIPQEAHTPLKESETEELIPQGISFLEP